jgi:hypothetical protein
MVARTMGDAKQERDIRDLGVREISQTRSRGGSAWLADRNRDWQGYHRRDRRDHLRGRLDAFAGSFEFRDVRLDRLVPRLPPVDAAVVPLPQSIALDTAGQRFKSGVSWSGSALNPGSRVNLNLQGL